MDTRLSPVRQTAHKYPAYAYIRTDVSPEEIAPRGRIILFETPVEGELSARNLESDSAWLANIGQINWNNGVIGSINVKDGWKRRGYGRLLVELALQCNPDLKVGEKVSSEGRALLDALKLRASDMPSEEPVEAGPPVVPYSTETGVWLVADTPEGRELMHQVPEHPAMWQLDATRHPSMGAGRLYGALAFGAAVFLATGIAAGHWVSGAVMAGLLLVLLALLEVVRRRATRDWQRMQDSALAVPAPLELWSEAEQKQLFRRRRVAPGRLESLPMLNGVPALSLLWQAGRRGATAAALDALGVPHTQTPATAIERRRQREVVNELLGR